MSGTSEQTPKLVVVMDGFGGDWTPFAVLTGGDEAIELREMLEADADAVCSKAPYYESKQAVRDGNPSDPPADLEAVNVAFAGKNAIAVSDDDWAAREAQIQEGGLRSGKKPIYYSAEAVVQDNPEAVGKFIASQMTAEDVLEAIR